MLSLQIVLNGRAEIIERLLSEEANVNSPEGYLQGGTALHAAAEEGFEGL